MSALMVSMYVVLLVYLELGDRDGVPKVALLKQFFRCDEHNGQLILMFSQELFH